jgi:hypothetical protein
MRSGRRFPLILAAALLLGAPARADLVDDARRVWLKKARPDLEALGAWCGGQGLLRKRAAVAEALLSLDPDHEQARGWLQFKRGKHDDWVRASGLPPPVDGKPDDFPEWVARRTEVLDPLRGMLERVCDQQISARKPGRDRTLRVLVALYPGDAGLRAKRGERLVEGRWVLDETAATVEGRRRVEKWAKEALKAAAAKEPVVDRNVPGDEIKWACSASLENVFVATTGNAKDSSALASKLVAAQRFVDAVMGRRPTTHPALRCDMLGNYWDNKRYVEKCKELSAERKKDAIDSQSWWRDDDRLVVCDYEPAAVVDDAVRQVVNHQLSRTRRIWHAPAWLSEGLGLYLTWRLVGTRLTYFVKDTGYADEDVTHEMIKPTSDWLALARKIAQKQGGPRLPILAGTPLNAMTGEDDVMAFAAATYLVECRREAVPDLFEAAASSRSIEDALTTSMGLDLESLDARFARWLEETR